MEAGPEACSTLTECANDMPVYANIAAFEEYTFTGNGEAWLRLHIGSHDIVRWEVAGGDFYAQGGSSCNGSSPTHVQLIGGVQTDVYVHVLPVFPDSCAAWLLEVTLEYR